MPDTLLRNVEHVLDGRISGPECIRERDGEYYVAQTGEVVKISGNWKHVTHVARFGKPCGKQIFEWIYDGLAG